MLEHLTKQFKSLFLSKMLYGYSHHHLYLGFKKVKKKEHMKQLNQSLPIYSASYRRYLSLSEQQFFPQHVCSRRTGSLHLWLRAFDGSARAPAAWCRSIFLARRSAGLLAVRSQGSFSLSLYMEYFSMTNTIIQSY